MTSSLSFPPAPQSQDWGWPSRSNINSYTDWTLQHGLSKWQASLLLWPSLALKIRSALGSRVHPHLTILCETHWSHPLRTMLWKATAIKFSACLHGLRNLPSKLQVAPLVPLHHGRPIRTKQNPQNSFHVGFWAIFRLCVPSTLPTCIIFSNTIFHRFGLFDFSSSTHPTQMPALYAFSCVCGLAFRFYQTAGMRIERRIPWQQPSSKIGNTQPLRHTSVKLQGQRCCWF